METANYSAPPVPPRPYSSQAAPYSPPPVPPLPPGYLREEPLAAPRPQRLNPDLPADMARNLDEQLAYSGPRLSSPPPPGNMNINHAPGFVFPGAHPPPPHYGSPPMSNANAPMSPMPQIQADDGGLSNQMGGLSLNGGYHPRQRAVSNVAPGLPVPQYGEGGHRQRTYSASGPPPPNFAASPPLQGTARPLTPVVPGSSSSPNLTAPLPTIASLQSALPAVESPSADVSSRVAWIRDVLLLVNRATAAANKRPPISIDPITGPARISDPGLQRLVDTALPLLISLAPGPPQQGQQLTPPLAEALYMRASLTASGAFPSHLPQNQRGAFREFEAAARSGYSPASWFKIGRDYELFNDLKHAIDCFDRGARAGDESCLYRLGMANLLGQLGMTQDYAKALPMLQRAATLATINVPQPAYVYALILLGDTTAVPLPASIPPHIINSLVPQGSTAPLEARKHLERAAYLHFTPAQYKLGHAYEFAEPPFPFDALLSVQYYSLASQTGEPEADLALSRWFLCGSEGTGAGDGFKRDENLAFIFGEKAAKKGLPSAEFALGYYWEVGVGVPAPDIQKALNWYEQAASHGNNDAVQRLTELKKESAHTLTRQEHEAITENKLVRKRTQAKARSDAAGGGRPTPTVRRGDANQVLEGIRQNSLQPQPRLSSYGHPGGHQSPPPPMPSMPIMPNHGPGPDVQDPAARLRNRPRYSLIDPGSNPSSPPGGPLPHRVASASGRGSGGRIPSGPGGYPGPQSSPPTKPRPLGQGQSPPEPLPPASAPSSPPMNKPMGGTKYNTFADMGVQGGRAEKDDCVIM